MPPTLKSTSNALSSKKPAQTAVKAVKEEAATRPQTPTEKAAIRTVLVASYGWPTEGMQPSRRQGARR